MNNKPQMLRSEYRKLSASGMMYELYPEFTGSYDKDIENPEPWNFGKEDKRPKKGWWAPGGYTNYCRLCFEDFIGDKRAGHCADCEYNDSIDTDR